MDITTKKTGIEQTLKKYDIKSLEQAKEITQKAGIDVEKIVKGIQTICFDNAVKAYELGVAIALKCGVTKASEVALKIGEGLQAYCILGSVADVRHLCICHG